MERSRKCKVVVDGAYQDATFHQFKKRIPYGSVNRL
jgi:hypothetical protein